MWQPTSGSSFNTCAFSAVLPPPSKLNLGLDYYTTEGTFHFTCPASCTCSISLRNQTLMLLKVIFYLLNMKTSTAAYRERVPGARGELGEG